MGDSLLAGLTLRLALVLVVVMGVVLWQIERTLDRTGDMAQDELLRRQAAEIINSLSVEGGKRGGKLHVNLSPESASAYVTRDQGYVYYLQDANGRMLAQSDPMASVWVQPALLERPSQPTLMNTESRDGESSALYLMVQPVMIPGGPLYLIVGQYRTIDDVLLQGAKTALMPGLLLVLGPLFLLALVVAVALVRQGLQPLHGLALAMGQAGNEVRHGHEGRVAVDGVPREIRPVVNAFNDVLMAFEKSIAAQQALTADTAHQLKTPLAVLQARLEQMEDFKGKADLNRDVQRMNRLVRQLLHYAVLTQHPATLQPADLTAVARDVVSSLVPLARQAKVDLRFDAPDKPVMVKLDQLQVVEALSNLIDNAIRHTPAKSAGDVEGFADGEITVRDRGPGIPLADQAMLFTRFWQGPTNQGTESEHGGAGLGLAVVAEVMRQHGGAARMDNRDGGGAVFTLGFQTV
jgi:signal transduction histidine kinase